ncbi:uncharacterized protein LOC143127428 isoform X2 [Alosa pseudoharengus]
MAEIPPNNKRQRRDDSTENFPETDNCPQSDFRRDERSASENDIGLPKKDPLVADNQQPEPLSPSKREEKSASEKDIPKEDTLVADNQQPEPLSPSKSGSDDTLERKIQSTDKQIPVPPPGPIQFTSVKPDSVSLLWGPPNGLTEFQKFRVTCNGQLLKGRENVIGLNTEFPYLFPGMKYEFTVATVGKDGQQSKCVSASTYTEIPAPKELMVKLDESPALVTWKKLEELDQPTYVVSLCREGYCLHTAKTKNTEYQLLDIDPKRMHTVRVSVALENGSQGTVATQCIHAGPDNVRTVSVTATTAKLEWSWEGRDQCPHNFLISYHSKGTEPKTNTAKSCSTVIKDLKPGTDYTVSVCSKLQDGGKSLPSKITFQTSVPKPVNLQKVGVASTSASLKWSSPREMGKITHRFVVSYSIKGTEKKVFTDVCKIDLDLEPGTDYSVSICTQFNDRLSAPETITIHTKIPPMKFFTIVIGNTQNHHEPLKRMLINKGLTEVHNVENCDVILAFCVIVSRVGTDMEAALKEIPDSKPAVLVVMHHTFDPDHVTPNTSRFVRDKETVDILFHEDKGILSCPRNRQAENTMVEMVCVCAKLNSPGSLPQEKNNPLPTTNAQPSPAKTYTKTDAPENSTRGPLLYQHEQTVESKESVKKSNSISITASSKEVKYFAIVIGNTLGADKEVQKRLADKGVLPKEESSQCDFLLVFYSVVSPVRSDIEKALKHIPDDKPSILMVIHHTFNTDYLPPDTRRHESSNMLIVHCLFYEDTGLLKCQRNDEAYDHISKWLHGKFPNFVEKSCQNVSRA